MKKSHEPNLVTVHNGGKKRDRSLIKVITIYILQISLHWQLECALQKVSQDCGRLQDERCDELMDIDEWEDVIEQISGDVPDGKLEISHEDGEYAAVCEYHHYLGERYGCSIFNTWNIS